MTNTKDTLPDQSSGRRMGLGGEAERVRFEQYRGGDFERDAQGYYTNPGTAQDWAMWQAALSTSQPQINLLPDDSRIVEKIAVEIEHGKLNHAGFYRNTQLAETLRRVVDAALSARPYPPSSFDLEEMLAACVPGGDMADPQTIADNIRHWFAAQPSPGGQGPVAEHHIMPLAREVLAAQCRARLEFASEQNIKTGRHDENWPELEIIAHALRHPHYMEQPEGGSPWKHALSAQPSPADQDALVTALEVFERRRADIPYEVYEQVKAVCAVLAARRPVGEHAEGDEFLAGVCVALQCVTAQDSGVLWAEIVRAVGVDDLLQYATFIEPAEWDLAGFGTYASTELNRRRPRSKAAKQATRPPPHAVHHQAALLAEERAHGNTIDQRDRCEEVADELAARIASITGVDIGEHSSANCPWQNAIDAAEAYQPAQAVDLGRWSQRHADDLHVAVHTALSVHAGSLSQKKRAAISAYVKRLLIDSQAAGK